MGYFKFRADKLFTGYALLDDKNVLITDEKGKIEAIVPLDEAGEDVQYSPGVLTPGFINCHCHLELSHMKDLIPQHTGLVDFVFKVVTLRHFAESEILEAIDEAEQEMINNGIVAVGDICNNILTLSQKEKKNLHYYNFVELTGWLPQVAETRFQRSKTFFDAYNNAGLTAAMAPHAPYSVSEKLWELMQPWFHGKTISIHNQETAFEDHLFVSNSGDFLRMYQLMNMDQSFFKPTGKSSLQTCFEKMSAAKNTILVHNTFTKQDDISHVKNSAEQNNQQVYFCLCINANLYIENSIPPVDLFVNNNCNIVIGTDSLASNHSLSVLDELKIISKNFPQYSITDLLQWATINGAKALQLENLVGSFEKNKQPGVVLLSGLQENKISQNTFVSRLF